MFIAPDATERPQARFLLAMIHRHIHRTYVPGGVYFVTTNVRGWFLYFRERELAEMLIGNIWWSQKEQEFIVYAFVVMPDHLHLLTQPQKTNISEIMHSIKNNSSRDIRRFFEHQPHIPLHSGGAGTSAMEQQTFEWQSFYDHIITDERDFTNHVEYIRHNPVKAGFVEQPEDYPFLYVDWDAIQHLFGG